MERKILGFSYAQIIFAAFQIVILVWCASSKATSWDNIGQAVEAKINARTDLLDHKIDSSKNELGLRCDEFDRRISAQEKLSIQATDEFKKIASTLATVVQQTKDTAENVNYIVSTMDNAHVYRRKLKDQ